MTEEQITLVGICLTFLIGLLNFIYSIENNTKTRFINTVTSSRVKWIDDLRKNISEYISLIPLDGTGYINLFEKKQDFIEKFNKLNMIIELMLNKNDPFDMILINNLANINKKVIEIMNCVNLLKYSDLQEFEDFGTHSKHDIKVRLINELNSDTKNIFKNEIISKIQRADSEVTNMDSYEVIIKCEYEGWGIKKDAYFKCISEISKEIKSEIDNLASNSEILLKKEWDRVKIESQVGKDNMDNHDWSITVGFLKLNKIFRSIFVIMVVLIIILTIIA